MHKERVGMRSRSCAQAPLCEGVRWKVSWKVHQTLHAAYRKLFRRVSSSNPGLLWRWWKIIAGAAANVVAKARIKSCMFIINAFDLGNWSLKTGVMPLSSWQPFACKPERRDGCVYCCCFSIVSRRCTVVFNDAKKKKTLSGIKSFHSASLKEAAILNSELEVVETPLVFQPEILVKFLAQKIQLLGCDETHNNNNNNNNNNNKQLQQLMRWDWGCICCILIHRKNDGGEKWCCAVVPNRLITLRSLINVTTLVEVHAIMAASPRHGK